MGKEKLTNFVKGVQNSLIKHSPEILTGIGIAGMITTTILAIKVTPKAVSLIDKEIRRQNRELLDEAERNDEEVCHQISKLKPIEVVKVTWKCYIPVVTIAAASIGCLIGASSVH